MLYSCSESLLFWEKFTQWWEAKFSETIVLSVNAILFGWHQNANNKRVLNYILIIAKYYIFTTSVCDNKLSFDCFLLRLNSKLDVLRTIAIKNKSLNKFETTLAPLSQFIYLFIYLFYCQLYALFVLFVQKNQEKKVGTVM